VSDRWMPLLAAVVGVIGGMGGAFIGGYIANEGQEQRFEDEQDVRREELRRTTYAEFLQAASNVNQGTGDAQQRRQQIALTDAARAKVSLFATTAIEQAATALSEALIEEGECPGPDPTQREVQRCYFQAQGQFVKAARAQLEAGH